MRLFLAFPAFTLLLPCAAIAQTKSNSNLTNLVVAELARFPAKTGVYIKQLSTGEECSIRGDDHFNSASIIKIPVMIRAFQLAEQNKLRLEDRVEIKASDFRVVGYFDFLEFSKAHLIN
jgi:beta-lactamase class A